MSELRHPISWLKLEQYHLGELSDTKAASVARHLSECDACRSCMDRIEAGRVLKPLPDVAPSSFWERFRLPLEVAAAAAMLLLGVALHPMFARDGEERESGTVDIRGGESTLTVLRERNGSVVENPATYRDGDRFSLKLTTSATAVMWDTVVISGDEIYFPMKAPLAPTFHNQFPFPGAFRLSDTEDVTLCAFPSKGQDERERIRASGRTGLPESAICRTVSAQRR